MVEVVMVEVVMVVVTVVEMQGSGEGVRCHQWDQGEQRAPQRGGEKGMCSSRRTQKGDGEVERGGCD